MTENNGLSREARQYAARFCGILNTMIDGMTCAELTDSISHNFIVQMIPHHEAAIEMSRNLLQYPTITPLRSIAENIISSQTKSIADMKAAYAGCSELCNTERELTLYQNCFRRITRTMFTQMGNAKMTNQINADFMREMIPHHMGAIRMSKNALRFPICPELKPILDAIIVSQTRGVREMETLLRQISCC